MPSVAHDRDPVTRFEDLVEAVGNEQDGRPVLPQAADDGEEPLDLDAGERGGGLVHDQDTGVEGEGLGDLDQLLIGDG